MTKRSLSDTNNEILYLKDKISTNRILKIYFYTDNYFNTYKIHQINI